VDESLHRLLPAPKQATLLEPLAFGPPRTARVPDEISASPALARLLRILRSRVAPGAPNLDLSFDEPEERSPSHEAYEIQATGSALRVRASSPAGFRHALQTLVQWLELHPPEDPCPGLSVRDEPDLAERGVMLDISRDRVPTLATACNLIELLASWKINRFQLYTEHTFAYPGAEHIWSSASPWTSDEIQALSDHAAMHGIELVPNQQSFGHMHRWLTHSSHRHLAEVPDGVEHPFHTEKQPFSLCPTDPECLSFLASLYDVLLPNFNSSAFNVGLDETFDLGMGRSGDAVEDRGLGAVFLEFLTAVHELVSSRGHRMQFWADIALRHPEVVEKLPGDCEPILWGYEANHPLDEEAATLAASCSRFQIAPGTSSWQSLGGRTDNCLANLRSASRAARTHSAAGMLITDWGDRGHLQPLPVSYLGFLHGAEAAWNGSAAEARTDAELAALLDHHAYRDPGAGLGTFSLALGRASDPCGISTTNLSTLFFPVGFPERSLPDDRVPDLDHAALERARGALTDLRSDHGSLDPNGAESSLASEEFDWVLGLMRCSCDLAEARLETPHGSPLSSIPEDSAIPIAERLRSLGERHADLWLVRSRPGGLADSVERLTRIADTLHPHTAPA